MLYDTNLKIAYWVSYPLCGWYLEGNIGYTRDWAYDPQIAENLQANLKMVLVITAEGIRFRVVIDSVKAVK